MVRVLAEVGPAHRAYLGDDVEDVSRGELLRRAGLGEVTVLDVRPAAEHACGHIPGGVSIPVSGLGLRLAGLPEETDIVAYCRGTYCVFAHDAVRMLHAHGRTARRLAGGMPEWRLAGLPVTTSVQPART